VNQAAIRARGDFIAYQFDDDRWVEDSLKVRVEALDKMDRPALVYGSAQVDLLRPDGTCVSTTLGEKFNFGKLASQNYIANNAVLHHRQLFDLAGMYDPHIILRRFSDYDLWLRFSKYAELVWIDKAVSHVRANLDNSLGKEIRFFYMLCRKALSRDRDRFLKPDAIENYDVLNVESFSGSLTGAEVENYRRNVLIPFLANFNDYCAVGELDVAAGFRDHRLNLLTIKPDYSTSLDVTINNFVNLPFQRAVANIFVPERELAAVDFSGVDITVLYRTIENMRVHLANKKGEKIPTVYLMDDNMLHFHEVETESSFLKPGGIAHRNIVRQISAADACIGYSKPIIEDFQEYNRKTIRLDTNIRRKYVVPRFYNRGKKIRVAVLSGGIRAEILRKLWSALAQFAECYADEVELHFWGIDPAAYDPLACEVQFKPFNHNYESYLGDLLQTSFDIVLAPLDYATRAARSKSPIKLLEALAAGAICIFSDAPPYSEIPDGCCLKVPNTVAAWQSALHTAFDMGADGRSEMLECARALVAERYTTETRFYDFLAAYEAVCLHAKLGDKVVLFAFHEAALGGATLHLLHHAGMARSLGFDVVGLVPENDPYFEIFKSRWDEATNGAPVVTAAWPQAFDEDEDRNLLQRSISDDDQAASSGIASLLEEFDIGLLHFATWSPTMTVLARRLAVPSVASVHQYYPTSGPTHVRFADAIHCSSLAHGARWEQLSQQPVRRMICPVGEDYYRLFQGNRDRLSRADRKPFRILVSGTLQPRKNQLAVVQAAKQLKQFGHDVVIDFIGYIELVPEYFDECKKAVEESGLNEEVRFHGFVDDPLPFYALADLLVVASIDESMPQTIIQAMASGIPVISTNVGGVKEILRHRYTGLLSRGAEPGDIASVIVDWLSMPIERRLEMIDRAKRTAQFLARASYVKFELVSLYNEAFAEYRPPAKAAPLPAKSPYITTQMSPAMRLMAGLFGRERFWARVSPELEEIRQFSGKHFPRFSTYRIIPSEDLRRVLYREYFIPFKVDSLNGVSLVFNRENNSVEGFIGIEIVTISQGIVAQVVLPLEVIDSRLPADFILSTPVKDLGEGWYLRIFAKDADAAVSVYEIKGKKTPVPFVCFQ
jgi:glycosyltransferase involved in cell wall biosynthesis